MGGKPHFMPPTTKHKGATLNPFFNFARPGLVRRPFYEFKSVLLKSSSSRLHLPYWIGEWECVVAARAQIAASSIPGRNEPCFDGRKREASS